MREKGKLIDEQNNNRNFLAVFFFFATGNFLVVKKIMKPYNNEQESVILAPINKINNTNHRRELRNSDHNTNTAKRR